MRPPPYGIGVVDSEEFTGATSVTSNQPAAPAAVHVAAKKGIVGAGGQLPHLAQIQRSFGRHDVSGVQAHVGAEATASAQEMGAAAYATGNHVVLGAGTDLHTVAHEAAHVVQQRAGVHLKGGVGAAGDAYERNADEVADRVVRGESAEDLLPPTGGTSTAPSVQRIRQEADHDYGTTIKSDNRRYWLENHAGNETIYAARGAPAPRYSAECSEFAGGVKQFQPLGKFLADCLHSAEEIMHGQELESGEVRSRELTTRTDFGDTKKGNWQVAQSVHENSKGNRASPGSGSAYAIVEREERNLGGGVVCQYHAAAVVAQDGQDRITMEVFGNPDDGERTSEATYCIYSTDPYSTRTFQRVWSRVFPNGVTVSLERKP